MRVTETHRVLCPRYRRQTKFAKVMFLHLSVIVFTVICLPQCMLGYTHPWEQTPPPPPADTPQSRHPPGSRHPPAPRSRHPWEQTAPKEQTPPCSACWVIRVTSGRYASYWNAYLYSMLFFPRHLFFFKMRDI